MPQSGSSLFRNPQQTLPVILPSNSKLPLFSCLPIYFMYKYIILFILLEYNILNPTIMHLRDLPDMGTVVYCLSLYCTGCSALLYSRLPSPYGSYCARPSASSHTLARRRAPLNTLLASPKQASGSDQQGASQTRRAHHHLPMTRITITFPSSPASFLLQAPQALLRPLYLALNDEHTT